MGAPKSELEKKLSWKKMLIPVVLGLLAATYMLYSNLNEVRYDLANDGVGNYILKEKFKKEVINFNSDDYFTKVEIGAGNYKRITYHQTLKKINWTWISALWLFIALLMVVLRDFGYMYRIRVLTDNKLSWRQSFDTIMMWEAASAVTPSVVGGSGVAIFILNREGISVGKSTAVVMITAMLDELFYIITVPFIFIFFAGWQLFPEGFSTTIFERTLGAKQIFFVGYGFILLLTLSIVFAIFLKPRFTKYFLLNIFRFGWLRKWRYKVIKIGDDIITTSKELKNKPRGYWIKSSAATFLAWTARFWVVNFLLLTVASVNDHFLIYARQLVMWVIMLISPTPGGSGFAEVAFSNFLEEFIPFGLAGAFALVWRFFTYYPYLFVGAIILPRWFKRTAIDIKKRKEATV